MSAERPELSFYEWFEWDESATGYWDAECGLNELRDYAIGKIRLENMANALLTLEPRAQVTALVELTQHGNIRQAVVLTRELINLSPDCRKKLRDLFPLGDTFNVVMTADLACFPSYPTEDPLNEGARPQN